MFDLKRGLEPYEKVLVIFFLLIFPPGLVFFLTWEQKDSRNKGGKLFLIIAVSVILTFYFIILTLAANNMALEYANPEGMPAFWRYVYISTRPLFNLLGQWISYAVVFVALTVAGSLICRLVARRHSPE